MRAFVLIAALLFASPAIASPGISIGESGGNHTVLGMFIGTSGGNKSVINCFLGTSGGNKYCYQELTVALSPASLSASRSTIGTATTGSVTATPSGGSGSYSYSWSVNDSVSVGSPTSAATTFSLSLSCTSGTVFSTASVNVTDNSTGATAAASLPATFSWTGTSC